MLPIGKVLVPLLFCVGLAVVPGVQSLVCTDIRAYNYLNDFVGHDKCESVDLVFKYLHDMTEQHSNGDCRRDIINKLANLFGVHTNTADYCQCSGTFQLQNYSRSSNDGILNDLADTCLRNQPAYRELYNQFFNSQAHPQGLHCRTHHSLWTKLRDIGDSQCQRDIVYHISYAFSQHGDPCTCSEKYVATSSSPSQHPQGHTDHCNQYASYRELASLLNTSKCMSANSVWHLLDDLQVRDSTCRKNIQNHLTQIYNHLPTERNDVCVCTPKHTLSNKGYVILRNGSHDECFNEKGSTYSTIERDLFTHITDHGCKNHDYLWPTLAGVKDYHCGHNCLTDCTQDFIVRAAISFPSQASDSCVCVPHATESLSTSTTTTTTATTTPQHTTTPTTTTIKSDVITTTPHATESLSTTTTTTTTTPQHTTTPATTIKSDVITTTQHMCNKYDAIEDIAKSIHVTHPDATPCNSNEGGSDDAYTIVTCNMAPPRTWTKGTNVMSTCSAGLNSLPTYIPIATFSPERSNFLPEGAQSGIFLGCDGNGIKMAVQKCNGAPTIIHVANGTFVNNPDNYYTIA